ncbi:hypothetical protein VTI74DRAFT_3900 [Chaetomium olivicolor]
MCGRYALALRPSQIRQLLEDDDLPVDDAPADEGDGAPRQSYNFAPGYYGVVYRADVPDRGAGTAPGAGTAHVHATHSNDDAPSPEETVHTESQEDHQASPTHSQPQPTPSRSENENKQTHYKLQSMKWGLIPSWTKHSPTSYTSMLKTINCRADSLASPGGMWASMKSRKRCVVVAQGFYEWLKTGPGGKEKVPHYVKRKDGKAMLFAGLWDCVRYDGKDGQVEKQYTYTIVTTDSNAQLKFLHDRMPVILDPGSEALWTWLDPARTEWSRELQSVLRPYEGELEVYPVSKDVGKVGNDSPMFVVPVASRENKGNIANFFANAKGKGDAKKGKVGGAGDAEVEVEKEDGGKEVKTVEELEKEVDDGALRTPKQGVKREADEFPVKGEPPAKKAALTKAASPVKGKQQARGKISATSNVGKSPVKGKAKADGSQKITKFFGNSA